MISPIIPGGSTTEEGPIIMAWWSAFGVARLHFLDWLSIIVGVWGCGLIKAAVKAESGRCEAQHRGFNPRRRASSRRDLRNLISPAQKEMTFFHNGGSSTSVHRSLFFKSMLAIKRSSASFSMVSVVSVMDFFFFFWNEGTRSLFHRFECKTYGIQTRIILLRKYIFSVIQ